MRRLPLENFNNYCIDEVGQVWSTRIGGAVSTERKEPFPLKGWIDDDGYLQFTLTQNGKRKRFAAHKLLMLTFVSGHPFDGAQVRHLDGNPANNKSSNLAWGTAADNSNDMVRHGRSAYGEKNCKAKLTAKLVEEIRLMCTLGVTKLRIADRFGISSSQVSKIDLRQVWKREDLAL